MSETNNTLNVPVQHQSEVKGGTLTRITGLWLTKSKNNQWYLSGSLNGARVLVFQNTRKEQQSEKAPDHRVFIAPPLLPQGSAQQRQQNGMVELTALWRNETKSGQKMYSGPFGGSRFLLFENGFKKDGDKQPNFILYTAPSQTQSKTLPPQEETQIEEPAEEMQIPF